MDELVHVRNIKSLNKVDNIQFIFNEEGKLFSTNLKDVVKKIVEELKNG